MTEARIIIATTDTSGASVSFGGAGSANYTINSGGNTLHGTLYDFNRNTVFDTWGYVKQPVTSTGIETKPGRAPEQLRRYVERPHL